MKNSTLPSSPPPGRRAALVFIFISLLTDVLAFGLIIPVLPRLIEQFLGGDLSRAAIWYGSFQIVFLAAQFFFTPVLGTLSDRFGRRPVILLSNLGLGLDFLFMALVETLPLLLLGRLISGVTAASFSSASAYIADVTPPERRAQAFGMIGVAFGLGLVIAPVLGGLLGTFAVRLPFWVAFAMSMANFCYGLFVLPESLPAEKRSERFEWAHANPFGALKLLGRYPRLLGLIGVAALDALVRMVAPTTFVLYAYYRFGWGPLMVGITMALIGVLQLIVQGGLVKWIVGRLGERRALIFGLACGTLGLAGQGFAPTGYWFWAAMPIVALWGVAQPALQALMSYLVDPREQGRLQGTVMSVSSLSGIVGSIVFPATLAVVTASQRHDMWAGAPFFLAAVLVAIALPLTYCIVAHLPVTIAAARTAAVPDAVMGATEQRAVIRAGDSSGP